MATYIVCKIRKIHQFYLRVQGVKIYSVYKNLKMITPNTKSGRKRKRNPNNWQKNIKKRKRNSGSEYISTSGKIVAKKLFYPVENCCKNSVCVNKVHANLQKLIFDKFWGYQDYNLQNVFLESLLILDESKKINGQICHRLAKWQHLFPTGKKYENVCFKFLKSVLMVSEKKIKTVKKKIKFNENICNMSGKYEHSKKLNTDVTALIKAHCESLPHNESHYRKEHSKLKYFEDSSLTLRKLYLLFLDFYAAITGDETVPISETTYINYFNYNLNFAKIC